MPEISAREVKRLRDATGAGFMDAKRALTENDGDFQSASNWLRQKGLSASGKRAGRQNVEGAVALARSGDAAALVELRSETDFVAKSPDFVDLVHELAQLVADKGEDALSDRAGAIDDLKVALKENIELGRVARLDTGNGNVVDSYLHVQNERGKNGVLVELSGGDEELAHDVAVHIAFARPQYIAREDVPEAEVGPERQLIEAQAREQGKPEQALAKIIEGRLTGWFKERCLLEQSFVKDEKRTVKEVLGDATVVRFSQVEIGG
ncbi:MAG: translation elongation factor Ts [Actinomycetota bacterium]|nr:translation elongation factor Ts [Actinomycetota bacterium]MDQ3574897.1 translation elongation factor Ts [Actinomycetota bacterium]